MYAIFINTRTITFAVFFLCHKHNAMFIIIIFYHSFNCFFWELWTVNIVRMKSTKVTVIKPSDNIIKSKIYNLSMFLISYFYPCITYINYFSTIMSITFFGFKYFITSVSLAWTFPMIEKYLFASSILKNRLLYPSTK